MNVLLASRFDPLGELVRAGGWGDTLVLTAADLSRPGWRYRTAGDAPVNTAVVDGRPIEAAQIDAVITRLPCVSESEIADIRADDRAYVAGEMTAWLAAWLGELPCPVLNRPSPVDLMGPLWSQDQWRWMARDLDLDLDPAMAPGDEAASIATIVSVVGGRAIDAPSAVLAEAATALACAAGVELLRVCFDAEDQFIGADYWIALENPDVRQAVRARAGA